MSLQPNYLLSTLELQPDKQAWNDVVRGESFDTSGFYILFIFSKVFFTTFLRATPVH
ncbi:MAG: hypothetical protein NTW85_08950 [Methylococcales bacterium]|nr:hypothetical protein [Methylococcales bacterium]